MAEAAWRARFRERVVEADDLFEAARDNLVDVRDNLVAKMLVTDAAAARARIQLALGALAKASHDLAFAMSYMKGAELLALRGGSYNPLMPYHEMSHLGDEYVAEINAWAKLREAGKAAEEACARIDRCRGHLETINLLLDHENLPGVNGFIENERLDATRDDDVARKRVALGYEMTNGARQDVFGVN